MANNSYTPEEDRFIIENCKKMNYSEIACHLGRPSEVSIRQRVKVLEQKGQLKRFGRVINGVFHPFYLDEEDELIKRLYPLSGKRVLVKKLNRPKDSIKSRALKKLHLKLEPPTYLNSFKAAQLLGVCQQTVRNWIYQGFLKADNQFGRKVYQHHEWTIEPQDFYYFIQEYYYLYDPGRVKDKFLIELMRLTPADKAITVSQASKLLGISKPAVILRVAKGKFPVAYKGFGPTGSNRWYLQLDNSAFQWFLDLADDPATTWLIETVRLRNPNSIEYLDILLRYESERVKQVRRRIKMMARAADKIVREFEATPEGIRLKNLIE